MKCKFCGEELRDKAKFCDQCGAVVIRKPESTEINQDLPFAIALDVDEVKTPFDEPLNENKEDFFDEELEELPEEDVEEQSEIYFDELVDEMQEAEAERYVMLRGLAWLLIGGFFTVIVAFVLTWLYSMT